MSVEKVGSDAQEITSTRMPFDAEFYKRADEFCTATLEQIPELNAIALVPLWNNQPENVPPGLLRLRDPQAPYLASLLKLLARLAAFNVEVHRDLVSQIKIFDNYAAQLAEKIRAHTEELNNIESASQGPDEKK